MISSLFAFQFIPNKKYSENSTIERLNLDCRDQIFVGISSNVVIKLSEPDDIFIDYYAIMNGEMSACHHCLVVNSPLALSLPGLSTSVRRLGHLLDKLQNSNHSLHPFLHVALGIIKKDGMLQR